MASMGQKQTRYIAAGCIVLDEASATVRGEPSSLAYLNRWRDFSTSDDGEAAGSSAGSLPIEVEQFLLCKQPLLSYKPLLLGRWIRLSFSVSVHRPIQGIVRVYILPDDVDNVDVPRSNHKLRKLRLKLLEILDFSRSTWNGELGTRSSSPAIFGESDVPRRNDDQSLLDMFNSIPSPEPAPEVVRDPYVREAIDNLLNSSVPGLGTLLYPCQQRSAALMLQREAQPEQVLDPRLVKVVDQEGRPWYYDAISGVALEGPRYYDRPRGGVLAEQMGCGKTLICLSIILATKHLPSETPELYQRAQPVVRDTVGSLADMAAACITANSLPWKSLFLGSSLEYSNCVQAIRRNPGNYRLAVPTERRPRRVVQQGSDLLAPKIFQSHASLVVVPPNLVRQWQQEIEKHTSGLSVLVFSPKPNGSPPLEKLLEYDIILVRSTRVEQFIQYEASSQIHFKRCFVDEGHKLGNSTVANKSDLLLAINRLQVTSRWVVTGTPSKGLYGVDETSDATAGSKIPGSKTRIDSRELEKGDLKRIGSIASHFLQMRPWANSHSEVGGSDKPADWAVYVAPSKHSSSLRMDCLRSTLNSMIIRHRLSDISNLLPTVEEKIVYLDPSYQDTMVLNLFSAYIIFNSVQSQRSDRDYFFHTHQKKALLELVSNLRQSSFFGGSFFSPAEILKAVDTATQFLAEGKVETSTADKALLNEAIQFSLIAATNNIKRCANLFREVPVYLENFPWAAGESWSLDFKDGATVLTDSPLVLELQKFLRPLVDSPVSLQLLLKSGRFGDRGRDEKQRAIEAQNPATPGTVMTTGNKELAGNTRLGQDNSSPSKRRSAILGTPSRMQDIPTLHEEAEIDIAAPLAKTQLVSTASAKLSYLIDQVVKHQEDEQMIIFFENENVAYYLASTLEMLQIHHLIYAKGISPDRRARYVNTFNSNPKFRVLLMDITQAAFGLDMRSASRIYFINPVLNPQIQAQAIGRACRISQKKPVTVETLVLRGSLEEMIVKRRGEMSQAELWKTHTILDDKPIYEWILNAKILPLPGRSGGDSGEGEPSGVEQMARLETPQLIFGRGFGRGVHPDQDLFTADDNLFARKIEVGSGLPAEDSSGLKRPEPATPRSESESPVLGIKRPRVRFSDVAVDKKPRMTQVVNGHGSKNRDIS